MVFRRSALDAIGGIPETAFMYGEEIFIGQALKQAGFQIRYVPQVTVEHHDGASVKQRWSEDEKLMVFKGARILSARAAFSQILRL